MEKKKKEVNEESFFYKFKNDSKYNAKVQLIVYAAFILFVVIYLNISGLKGNYDYNSVSKTIAGNKKVESTSLLDTISNNYNYVVTIGIKKGEESINLEYSGKSYGENMVINRKDASNTTFYKVGDEYYSKEEDSFKYIDVETVYEMLSYKYVEIEKVKELIKKAELDHMDNVSSGEVNYKYTLPVKDVVKSYNGSDTIIIDVNVLNSVLTINIDYTNLFKEIYKDYSECNIKYVYTDIDKVEEFIVIDK